MAITINGSGTITGVSAGGLPDGSVTADDLASTLDISGKTVTLPSDVGGITTGKVLQVVKADWDTDFSDSSVLTTVENTSLSANITPASTSSTILCICIANAIGISSHNKLNVRLRRTSPSTSDIDTMQVFQVDGSDYSYTAPHTLIGIDSPSTTSQLTYTLGYYDGDSGGNGSIRFNDYADNQYNSTSSITLMEIAG